MVNLPVVLTAAASAFAVLAALLHIAIFVMESIGWRKPTVWKRFGIADQQTADVTSPMAYNQGFYNLFLAIGAIVGVVLLWTGPPGSPGHAAGTALIAISLGSMLAAALVLVTSGRKYLRPAATQGTLPLIGLVLLVLALVL